MLRVVVAVVVGFLVAAAITIGVEFLFHAVTPTTAAPPAMGDKEALRAYVEAQPMGAVLMVLAGWCVAVFAGAWTAARMGRQGARPGWVVTGLFLLGAAANFYFVPHPLWVVAGATVLIVAGGWLGARLGARAAVMAPSGEG